MDAKKVMVRQLNSKIEAVAPMRLVLPPAEGWIKALRIALNMSAQQLGDKLSISRQAVQDLQNREADGSITIRSLKDAANALDMEFIYAIVPKDGNLDALISRKAKELAQRVVMRTSQNMKLEDQEMRMNEIERAMEEMIEKFEREVPKVLWD